jgi:hypothetical protein
MRPNAIDRVPNAAPPRRRMSAATALLLLASLSLAACGEDDSAASTGSDTGQDVSTGDMGDDIAGCTTGEAGCACANDDACADGLTCSDTGVCEVEDTCTPGDTGCTCLSDDTCSDAADECVADVCTPRTECLGELGCACTGGSCDDGLTCEDDVCTVGRGLRLTIAGGDTRACDVVVTAPDTFLDDVVFPAGVRGRMRTRNERTAIALIRTSDTALSGTLATLVFAGFDEVEADVVSAVEATCYDRLGAVVDTATVGVE